MQAPLRRVYIPLNNKPKEGETGTGLAKGQKTKPNGTEKRGSLSSDVQFKMTRNVSYRGRQGTYSLSEISLVMRGTNELNRPLDIEFSNYYFKQALCILHLPRMTRGFSRSLSCAVLSRHKCKGFAKPNRFYVHFSQ